MNQTVLVHAGAGGVGHVAIQLARSIGARIATTISTAEKADLVRQLGADKVIDYRDSDFVEEIMQWTEGRGVDVVLDTIGGKTFRNSLAAASVYGHVVTLLDPGNDDWKEARNKNLSVSFTLMLTPMLQDLPLARHHQGEILNHCSKLIENGTLKPLVSTVLPLEDAAQAHQLIEEGHVQGKIVLKI